MGLNESGSPDDQWTPNRPLEKPNEAKHGDQRQAPIQTDEMAIT
jgi:hypothetical protein